MLKNIGRYLLFRSGFLSNPAALVAVFYKASGSTQDAAAGDSKCRPDAQIHFAPAASEVGAKGNMLPIDGITIASCGVRPTSRGATHIGSAHSDQSPYIKVNFLATEDDRQVAIDSFRRVRDIFDCVALGPYGGKELKPGEHVDSDEEILDYIRTSGEPVHHLAGSCKMGNDELAVVDDQLRVRGVRGLRVADASIMPEIVSGNTHAACVMIAEKAVDFILQDS